jgi:glucosylceramidase
VHDHNWDIAQRAMDVIGNMTDKSLVDGIAFHCYAGDPSSMSTVKAAYPSLDIYFTECSGFFSFGDFQGNLMWNVNTLIIDGMRNWAKTVLFWNLAMDEKGSPNCGGCQDCRGVVTIHSVTG